MANRFREIKNVRGKVFGNRLVIGTNTSIWLKGDNMYSGKEGYFQIKKGIVLKFVPIVFNPS